MHSTNLANIDWRIACHYLYFRRAYFLPFVDKCILQMTERFTDRSVNVYIVGAVIPAFIDKCSFLDLEPAAQFFSQLLPGDTVALKIEFMRWQAYWARQPATDKRPDNMLDALRTACDLGTYPMLSTLMTIFATLPVTTATGERSFSALKFIKNYLRSMVQD